LTRWTSIKFSASFAARITRVSRAEVVKGSGVNSGGGEEQPSHHVLRHQPRQMGGRAQSAAFHLGQPEGRIF
jgi:hypothetical protein